MEVKITHTYVAFDGEEFDNEKECLEYEFARSDVQYVMFSDDGTITDDPENAYYVYLPREIDAKKFKQVNTEHDLSNEGLDDSDTGLFMWDDFGGEHWEYVGRMTQNAIANIVQYFGGAVK